MKLRLSIGYSGAELKLPVDAVLLAERLGFDWVATAEAYGSDAVPPLAYLAALTRRIRLGTGIMQLAARPPASAAMAAGTVDALAGGGRVIAGLGVSGPQIVEGWYGQPWGKPYWRIRDYVTIMRKVFERKDPVAHAGREISLPYTGPGALGVGKPLTSILHMNPRLPIWLGTGTESNVKLFFFSSRRRHTRCLSDWSSDVCSSDLGGAPRPGASGSCAYRRTRRSRNVGSGWRRRCIKALPTALHAIRKAISRRTAAFGWSDRKSVV